MQSDGGLVINDEPTTSRIGVIPTDHIVKRIFLAGVCVSGLMMSPLQGIAGDSLHRVGGDSIYYDDPYGWDDRVRRTSRDNQDLDTNSCIEGSVIGGLLGAGLGAALSRGNGRWVGVPVGGAAGALIGCQVDGG